MKKLIISQIKVFLDCWYVFTNKEKLYEHYHEKYLSLNKKDGNGINIEYAKVCAGAEGPKMFVSSMALIIGALIALFGVFVGGLEGELKEDFIHYGLRYGLTGLLVCIVFFVFDQLVVEVNVFKKCIIDDIKKEKEQDDIIVVKIRSVE